MQIWLLITSILEWSVLGLLLILSIWSIAIMVDRRNILKSSQTEEETKDIRALVHTHDFSGLKKWSEQSQTLLAGTLRIVLKNLSQPQILDRAVRGYLVDERLRLEKGLSVLATLGANAPFIGLFGTVLGIIRSFAALADNQAGASTVMAGISQALYATAAGLFVAIPAVIAFNTFSNRLRVQLTECEALKDQCLAELTGQNGSSHGS
jgi:biopolymer transport protein ExbB/TolQ